MATVFGYSPDTAEGNYSTFANPAATLAAGGFSATGVIVPATANNGGSVPVDPGSGLRPEVWVRNGPGSLNAVAPNAGGLTVLEVLTQSIQRAVPGQVWTRSQWGANEIRNWYLAHTSATVFAVFQP